VRSIPRLALLSLLAAVLLVPRVRGDDPATTADPLRQKRLELLQARVDELHFALAGHDEKELTRSKQPVLRWSNPVRDFVNDGVAFLLLDGERPRALVNARVRGREAPLASGELLHEFASFSPDPLTCRRNDRTIWSPKTAALVEQPLLDAPLPAARPVQRLAQMREQAARFVATQFKSDSPTKLRLLTQPLYRYQDKAAGIVDGALFAFVEGNDPEALLLLEAAAAEGKDCAWRYTLARMTFYGVSVKLADREVIDFEPLRTVTENSAPYHEISDGKFTLPE
jgi:hypothetical protein